MYVLVLHFLNSFANLLFPYVRQQHKSWHANFLRNFGTNIYLRIIFSSGDRCVSRRLFLGPPS